MVHLTPPFFRWSNAAEELIDSWGGLVSGWWSFLLQYSRQHRESSMQVMPIAIRTICKVFRKIYFSFRFLIGWPVASVDMVSVWTSDKINDSSVVMSLKLENRVFFMLTLNFSGIIRSDVFFSAISLILHELRILIASAVGMTRTFCLFICWTIGLARIVLLLILRFYSEKPAI